MSNHGARHARRANNTGYVRRKELAHGGVKYEARLATVYLGSFDTREAADAAIDAARRRQTATATATTTAPEGSAA